MTASTLDKDNPGKTLTDYHARAENVALRVTEQWRASGNDDTKALGEAVYQALVEEANLELRQILSHLQGQLQLAQSRASRGQPALAPQRIGDLLHGLDRANALIDVYLDRAAATRLVIRLDREPFDVAEAISQHLRIHGLHDKVRTITTAAWVDGDRAKLLDALGHLVTRFYFAARNHESVIVACADGGARIEGFVGLSPSHLQPEQLMDEIQLPLTIEDVGIDVAYTRAVLERHGGSLFVATAEDASVGFGFHLPKLPPEGA